MRNPCARVSLALLGALALGCGSTGTGDSGAAPPAPTAAIAVAEPASGTPDTRPILVVFTKPGCPACLKLAPALAEIKKDYEARVRFEEADTQAAPKLIFDYEISLTPTIILFADKKETARLLNPKPEEVRAALDTTLAARS